MPLSKVDLDGSGGISFDEFVTMMQLGEMETDFAKEINEAFKFFDKDGDGEVRNNPATWFIVFLCFNNYKICVCVMDSRGSLTSGVCSFLGM